MEKDTYGAMKKDLLKVCRLWYITRTTTQGMMVEKHHAEALSAFDKLIQDVIEKHNLL